MTNYNFENEECVYEYDSTLEQEYQEAEEKAAACYMEEHFPLMTPFDQYSTDCYYAQTLDGYLMSLIKGRINVSLRSDLDKHLMELLDDEWFFQWPLIRCDYGARLLRGIGCRKNIKRAVDILLPMAREGIPGALFEIGCCYLDGLQLEQSYMTAMYCWILASRHGHAAAQAKLHSEYWTGNYRKHKEFDGYVKHGFLCENLKFFIAKHNINEEDDLHEKLNNRELNALRKLCNRINRQENALLRDIPVLLSSSLFWSNEENPYKIHI